ncbi:hypothetical protein F5Y15DRAFT_213026 [Xylariaceae sp. FL0016]|nr:hypothetical protein F5Y15DRAFT_213026 [Xylariaceae sp. FL0016]
MIPDRPDALGPLEPDPAQDQDSTNSEGSFTSTDTRREPVLTYNPPLVKSSDSLFKGLRQTLTVLYTNGPSRNTSVPIESVSGGRSVIPSIQPSLSEAKPVPPADPVSTDQNFSLSTVHREPPEFLPVATSLGSGWDGGFYDGSDGGSMDRYGSWDGEQDYTDSEIVDDSDEGSASDLTSERTNLRLMAEQYNKLLYRRTALWEEFRGMRSRREGVEDSRQRKDQADLEFFRAAQAILPNDSNLLGLFKSMEQARIQYQKEEQHFEQIIDNLQDQATQLELAEQRFYATAEGRSSATFPAEAKEDGGSLSSKDSALQGISGDRPIHPLVEELRENLKDLRLEREFLANTRMKMEALRSSKPQPLHEDSLQVLRSYGEVGERKALEFQESELMTEKEREEWQTYEDSEKRARNNIDRYSKRAQYLEQKCLEKGALPTNPRDDTSLVSLGIDPFDGVDAQENAKNLAHPIFPTLLTNPSHLLEHSPQTAAQSLRMALSLPPIPLKKKYVDDAAREVYIESLLSESPGEEDQGYASRDMTIAALVREAPKVDRNDFISRWLLHKLHVSPMEAELLWSTFRLKLNILDVDRWQEDVLHFWWRDEAATSSFRQSDSASVNARTGSVSVPSQYHSESGWGLRGLEIPEYIIHSPPFTTSSYTERITSPKL